jgi:hypothetical protein
MRLVTPADVVTVASAGKQLLFFERLLVPLAREAVVTRADVEKFAAVVDGDLDVVLFCDLVLVPLMTEVVVTRPAGGAVDVVLMTWS